MIRSFLVPSVANIGLHSLILAYMLYGIGALLFAPSFSDSIRHFSDILSYSGGVVHFVGFAHSIRYRFKVNKHSKSNNIALIINLAHIAFFLILAIWLAIVVATGQFQS